MVKYICGDDDAGVYGFGYQIASVMTVLIGSINGARVPWTYEQLRDKVYTGLRRISTYLCVFIGSIVLMVALLSPEIVKILTIFGHKFEEYQLAVYVIPVVALGIYYTFVYDLFCSVEFYYGKTKYIMVASCIGAILNIILNAIFIPMVGLIAAAYTTLFCYIVFMFMHYIFMRKVCKNEKIEEPIYDYKMLFGISFMLFAIVILSLLTFKSYVIRFALLGIIVVIALIKRKFIMSVMGEMKK